MIVDESHENYAELKLHNEVMGVALAIWAHTGDSPVFRMIDKALDAFNEEEMRNVKIAFDMLTANMQRDIMADQKSENTLVAIDRFTRYVGEIVHSRRSRSA